jgi:hypothetical protein
MKHALLIDEIANHFGLDRFLLRAQVVAESAGDEFAFRFERDFFDRYIRTHDAAAKKFGPFAACSVGLLQVMVETAYEIGFTGQPWDLFTPKIGLFWGATYFRKQLDRFGGDAYVALIAYNGGPGTASQGPPYPNRKYADKVTKLAAEMASGELK